MNKIRIVSATEDSEHTVEVHYEPLEMVHRGTSYGEAHSLALGLMMGLVSCGVEVDIDDQIREDFAEFDEEAE